MAFYINQDVQYFIWSKPVVVQFHHSSEKPAFDKKWAVFPTLFK